MHMFLQSQRICHYESAHLRLHGAPSERHLCNLWLLFVSFKAITMVVSLPFGVDPVHVTPIVARNVVPLSRWGCVINLSFGDSHGELICYLISCNAYVAAYPP